jgi:Putative adhesin
MARWTIEEPTTLDFDGVVALKATLIAGSVSVLASDERPSVMIGDVEGPPLVVEHEAGMLTITHERLWEGVLTWLRTHKARAAVTVTVPRDCPLTLNLVSADAVITGMGARTSIRSAAGDVTLDGVTGDVDANTVSGAIEAQGLDGKVSFTSVSGDLALAGGAVNALAARTVSGRVAADIDLDSGGRVDVNTVSGEVALRIPESTGTRVTLNSAAGRIETSFPELDHEERTVTRSVTGKLGDGSARLMVNTVSGGVALLGRPGEGTTGPRMEK